MNLKGKAPPPPPPPHHTHSYTKVWVCIKPDNIIQALDDWKQIYISIQRNTLLFHPHIIQMITHRWTEGKLTLMLLLSQTVCSTPLSSICHPTVFCLPLSPPSTPEINTSVLLTKLLSKSTLPISNIYIHTSEPAAVCCQHLSGGGRLVCVCGGGGGCVSNKKVAWSGLPVEMNQG